ncbi:MAG: hypothetical protein CMJ18_11840 [Phycisphaeraceae bacterium]|nr:hypothetical protein [Phycisphaeraceae bacterium]
MLVAMALLLPACACTQRDGAKASLVYLDDDRLPYHIKAVKLGQPTDTDRSYAFKEIPDELDGAVYLQRPRRDVRRGLSGEISVARDCRMFVAVMTVWRDRTNVTDDELRRCTDQGWRLHTDAFSTTTYRGRRWRYALLSRSIEAGPVHFDLLGSAKIFMFKQSDRPRSR